MAHTLLVSTGSVSADLGSKDIRATVGMAPGKNIREGLQKPGEHSNHISTTVGLLSPPPAPAPWD